MPKTKTDLIHCDNCGEDYAAAYRRCPFCNAKPGQRSKTAAATGAAGADFFDDGFDSDYDDAQPRGGKRLANNRRGGGYGGRVHPVKIALYALSAVVILAAVWLLCTKFFPLIFRSAPTPSAEPSPSVSAAAPSPSLAPTPTPVPSPTPDPVVTDDPLSLDSPDLPAVVPIPTPSQAVTTQAPVTSQAPASGASLNLTDFTISKAYPDPVRLTVSGGKANAWSSANETVATVSGNGTVTAAGNGTTTITCLLDTGATLKATVRVTGHGSSGSQSTPKPSDSGSSSTTASLSTTDFTLSAKYGYSARLTVSGGKAASWSTGNSDIATVASDGTVTGHNPGSTTITCTLEGGGTLKAIVRVN